MGIKEKLANQYLELKKQFEGPEFKENLSTNKVSYLVKEFKKVDLEDKIRAMETAIEAKALRLKKEAFYATPEGEKYKKDLEERRELFIHVRKTLIKGVEGFVQNFLNEYIGEGWGCQFSHGWNRAHLSVGLKAFTPERIEKGYFFEFGHEFEITWDKEDFGHGELQMNYGTLGGFDLENGEGRLKYLRGMAEFADNKGWINKLKERFVDANAKLMEINRNIDEVDDKLKNPKID